MRPWLWASLPIAVLVLSIGLAACGGGDGGAAGDAEGGDGDGERIYHLATGDYTEAQLKQFVQDTSQEFKDTFGVDMGNTECLAAIDILLFGHESPIQFEFFVPTPVVQEPNPDDEEGVLQLLRPECASLS